MKRNDGRLADELRKTIIEINYQIHPLGSVLITMGNTKVICAVNIDDKVPPFLIGTGKGWLTAEYALLPSSTRERAQREASKGRVQGRTSEIQRLIGRSLRSTVDFDILGERTILIDCDVIQADGGTRAASITGSFIALVLAIKKLKEKNLIAKTPIKNYVAAISAGLVHNTPWLDLNYGEDSKSEVDMNFVMNENGEFIEIQGTAEKGSFDTNKLNALITLAKKGTSELINKQKSIINGL